jgi:hypothetical protein
MLSAQLGTRTAGEKGQQLYKGELSKGQERPSYVNLVTRVRKKS